MRYGQALVMVVLLGLTPTVDGAQRFSVHVEGRGHDVLLIPGLASSAEVWQGTAAGLRDHYRVHTIQVSGFAGTPAGRNAQGLVVAPLVEDLAAYIDARHLIEPIIIGHSLGGEAALMLAARHPASVGRIVVVDALPFYSLTLNPDATVEWARPQADIMSATLLRMSKEQFDAAQAAGAARLVKSVEARKKLTGATAASDQGGSFARCMS
jgi:pimeloyl-ACP methyl ester carboxylesterase